MTVLVEAPDSTQAQLDRENASFWNELCGSAFARSLGITDHSRQSLEKFDAAYFELYPYLLVHANPLRFTGKNVLEIGLGYGSLSEKIAAAGAKYSGLDIAQGPVDQVNHRLRLAGLSGGARTGSMLECPLPDESQDFVVSIGCYHHTGDIQRCVDHTYRILRPNGVAIIMLYNQFSYRQWLDWPGRTLKAWLKDWGLYSGENVVDAEQRRPYDAVEGGESCPEIVFTSVRDVYRYFKKFKNIKITKENCLGWHYGSVQLVSREAMLGNVGRLAGLDLYIEATK